MLVSLHIGVPVMHGTQVLFHRTAFQADPVAPQDRGGPRGVSSQPNGPLVDNSPVRSEYKNRLWMFSPYDQMIMHCDDPDRLKGYSGAFSRDYRRAAPAAQSSFPPRAPFCGIPPWPSLTTDPWAGLGSAFLFSLHAVASGSLAFGQQPRTGITQA